MKPYLNKAHDLIDDARGVICRVGDVAYLEADKFAILDADIPGGLVPVDAKPAPAPKPAPLPVEPAPPPAAKPAAPAVEREPLDALHHAKLRKLAEALGHTGDGSKADSLAFLDGCEPAEVDAAREGLGY